MTILFQAKFLFLAILFSSISYLVKSETPSHCSELYGCQVDDPQERIVEENLDNQEEMILENRLYDCREHYNRGLDHEDGIFYSKKYDVWVKKYFSFNPRCYDDSASDEGYECNDFAFDSYSICPREFNEWVNSTTTQKIRDLKEKLKIWISEIKEKLIPKNPAHNSLSTNKDYYSDDHKIHRYKSNSTNEIDNILANNTFICADTSGPRIEFEIPGKLNKKQFNFPIKIFKKDRKSFELRRAEGSFNDNVFKGHYYLDSNHIYGDPIVIYGDNKEDWYKVRFTYRSDTNQFIAMISKLTGDVFSCVKK